MTSEADQAARQGSAPAHAPRSGLSGKLLVLTLVLVMLAEVLIYVPSIANFRLTWLSDRLAVARTVAIVLDAKAEDAGSVGDNEKEQYKLPDRMIQEILDNLGAKTVAIKK